MDFQAEFGKDRVSLMSAAINLRSSMLRCCWGGTLLTPFSTVPIGEGAGGVPVSGGDAACVRPWREAAMFPLRDRNISGMWWLNPPSCSRGGWDRDAEELREAVPMISQPLEESLPPRKIGASPAVAGALKLSCHLPGRSGHAPLKYFL